MILLAFSVLDEKSGAFGHPFFVSAIGIATRMFGDWVNRKDTPLNGHPEDYRLYEIGTFDDSTAEFVAKSTPRFVGHALDYVERMPSEIREVKHG